MALGQSFRLWSHFPRITPALTLGRVPVPASPAVVRMIPCIGCNKAHFGSASLQEDCRRRDLCFCRCRSETARPSYPLYSSVPAKHLWYWAVGFAPERERLGIQESGVVAQSRQFGDTTGRSLHDETALIEQQRPQAGKLLATAG